MSKIKISPSLLACDFSKMGLEVTKISNFDIDMVHMDIMDGHFVPNISFGAPIVKSLRNLTNLIFDVHLMISDPYKYILDFVNSGADIITFHLESNNNYNYIINTINKIKNCSKKVGLAIKPNTSYEALIPYLRHLDLVLIMTVEPGFGGQKFMPEQLNKVKLLKNYLNKNNFNNIQIQIDGGVNTKTIKIIKNYPVDICVSGTCIFKSNNISETIKKLKL